MPSNCDPKVISFLMQRGSGVTATPLSQERHVNLFPLNRTKSAVIGILPSFVAQVDGKSQERLISYSARTELGASSRRSSAQLSGALSSIITNAASLFRVENWWRCWSRGRTITPIAIASLVPGRWPKLDSNKSTSSTRFCWVINQTWLFTRRAVWLELFNKSSISAQFFLEPGVPGDLDGTG